MSDFEEYYMRAKSDLDDAQFEIADLKRQLAECDVEFNSCSQMLDDSLRSFESMEQQLAESAARESRLREALENHSGNYKLSKTQCAVMNELLDQRAVDT